MSKRVAYILVPIICLLFTVSTVMAVAPGGPAGALSSAVIEALREKGVFVSVVNNLIVGIVGEGQVKVDGEAYEELLTYDDPTEVELEAIPDVGWYFARWDKALTGSENPATLLVDRIMYVDAVFKQVKANLIWEHQFPSIAGYIRCLDISNDGRFLALGSRGPDKGTEKRPLYIVDIETQNIIFEAHEHDAEIKRINWAPDDTRFATASVDETIKIWGWDPVTSTAEVLEIIDVGAGVEGVAFSPDGAYLYSYNYDDKVEKRDTTNWEVVAETTATAVSGSRIVEVSSDGTKLAVISYQETTIPAVEILDAETFNQLALLKEDSLVRYRDVGWSPCGNYVIVGGDVEEPGQRGGVVVWDIEAGTKIAEFRGDGELIFGRAYSVGWAPDGRYFGVSARPAYDSSGSAIEPGGCTMVWHAESLELIHKELITGTAVSFAWSPVGSHFASGTTSRYVQIWEWPDYEK